MIINPDILRRDTIQLLKQIDAQIKEVESEGRRMGVPAVRLRDTSGNWALSPLLLAKATAYNTLVALQDLK